MSRPSLLELTVSNILPAVGRAEVDLDRRQPRAIRQEGPQLEEVGATEPVVFTARHLFYPA